MAERNIAADELSKLTATWCNTLSAGAIVTGVLTPISQLQDPVAADRAGWGFIFSSLAYFALGLAIHVAGRIVIELRFKS